MDKIAWICLIVVEDCRSGDIQEQIILPSQVGKDLERFDGSVGTR